MDDYLEGPLNKPPYKNKQALRCKITGHPSGTDTRPEGQPCTCHDCRLQTRRKELEALVTKREGMVAENRLWIEESGGANRQPHGEDAFRDLAAKMRALGDG